MLQRSVYSILLQSVYTDKSARLLHALDELAGRVEAADSSIDAGLGLQGSRRKGCDLSNLQLPDPAEGPLPLFVGASEHQVMQQAADNSSRTLHSTADRQAWRSWVMSPAHMVHVVEAAWLLVALVFKQDDACAVAVQAHVCRHVQQHHVSSVLSGPEVVQGCSQLWTHTLADAACRLLRAAFPSVSELQDGQLQDLLQRQLRLYVTGLLPSDAAAPVLLEAQQPHADSRADDVAAAADPDAYSCAAGQLRSDACSGVADRQHRGQPCRHTARFVSVKPSAAVSACMAQKGLQPAPGLLQASAGQLARVTLPAQLVQQQRQIEQAEIVAATAQDTQWMQQCGVSTAVHMTGAAAGSTSPGGGSLRDQAAACVVAATEAVQGYEGRKAAAAAAVKAGCLSAQVQVQALQRQRAKAIAAGASRAKTTSNRVSGWLSEDGAATTCISSKHTPQSASTSAHIGHGAAAKKSPPAKGAGSKGSRASTDASSSCSSADRSRPLPSDVQCKAARHLLEGQLRAGDWRLAHAFNASLHDRCTNLAATVATLPPPPVTPMPPSAAAAAAGQDWGALVSSRVARSHVKAGGSGAVHSASSSSIKVMKAAKAIVEDVQRAFAATSSTPFGSGGR